MWEDRVLQQAVAKWTNPLVSGLSEPLKERMPQAHVFLLVYPVFEID